MSNKLIIAVVIIIILCAMGYFIYQLVMPSEIPNNSSNSTSNEQNASTTEPTSTEPYISVISPAGAETWKIGNTYEVSWKSSNVKSVDIILENWDKMDSAFPASIIVASNTTASLGKYSFLLASDKLPPNAGQSGNHFKIRIVSHPLDYTISGRSDDFFSIQ